MDLTHTFSPVLEDHHLHKGSYVSYEIFSFLPENYLAYMTFSKEIYQLYLHYAIWMEQVQFV